MRRSALTVFFLSATLGCGGGRPSPVPDDNITVDFSPRGGCTAAVVKALDGAKETVLVQAYSFSSTPIAQALVDAHRRGVAVQVILDKSQLTEKYSSIGILAAAGIHVLIDEKHKIAHNKVMVIDSRTVITGSFNFTKSAEEQNAENLLVIQDEELAKTYASNWTFHAGHSVKYTPASSVGRDGR